jgi:hypothetical protein
LQLLGQCTVELAFLRKQVLLLQRRLAELESSRNGIVEVSDLAHAE